MDRKDLNRLRALEEEVLCFKLFFNRLLEMNTEILILPSQVDMQECKQKAKELLDNRL